MSKPSGIKPLSRSSKINLLLYGDPGYGKTALVGTTPGRSLILRPPVDHIDSIKDVPEGMEEWVLPDWNEAHEAMDFLRQEGDQHYDWVWLDSISLWQDIGLDDLWETVIHEKPARARYGLDKQEYGINMFRTGKWVRHVVGARLFNFGMTAHVQMLPISLDPDAPEKLMPAIHGKVGGALGGFAIKMCGYMNVVAYLDVTSKGTRVLYTNATDRYYAKDQFSSLPKGRLVSPTMPKLIKAIEESRPAASKKKPRRSGTRRRTTTKGR